MRLLPNHKKNKRELTPQEWGAIQTILEKFKLTWSDIIAKKQSFNHANARGAIALFLREQNWTLEEIGVVMQKHHTSIAYLLKSRDTA